MTKHRAESRSKHQGVSASTSRDVDNSKYKNLLFRIAALVSIVGMIAAIALVFAFDPPPEYVRRERVAEPAVEVMPAEFRTLTSLKAMSDEEIDATDLGVLNLACLEELPGTDEIDRAKCLDKLDRWAELVRVQTEANLYHFYQDPGRYENSEAYFRMLMLVTVLQQDLGVRYNPERIRTIDFTQPEDLFIHGLIGYGNGGTCVSMPALYTAIAQRLEYPVSLVYAKQHVFCRWDAADGTRINIEGSSQGMHSYPDEHYMNWPKPITQSEVDSGQYLRTLSKRECFAAFLAVRGHCLEDLGRFDDALNAYDLAVDCAPKITQFQLFKDNLQNQVSGHSIHSVLSAVQQPDQFGRSRVITAGNIQQLFENQPH